jgi:hypothetical protein
MPRLFSSRSLRPLLLWPLVGLMLACASGTPRERSAAPAAVAPVSEDALRQRAEEAYAARDWASAERDYLALAKAVPGDGQAPFKLGNLYTRTGRLPEAATAYAEATRRDPGLTRAWHNLGVVQLRLARASLGRAAEGNDATEAATGARARGLVEGIDLLLAPGAP